MLARKLIVLACFLCACSAFAVELDQAVADAMSAEDLGIIADKTVATTEPVSGIETTASSGEETRPSGEENNDG